MMDGISNDKIKFTGMARSLNTSFYGPGEAEEVTVNMFECPGISLCFDTLCLLNQRNRMKTKGSVCFEPSCTKSQTVQSICCQCICKTIFELIKALYSQNLITLMHVAN